VRSFAGPGTTVFSAHRRSCSWCGRDWARGAVPAAARAGEVGPFDPGVPPGTGPFFEQWTPGGPARRLVSVMKSVVRIRSATRPAELPLRALNNRAFRTWPLADGIYLAIPSPGGAVSGAKTSSASSMT